MAEAEKVQQICEELERLRGRVQEQENRLLEQPHVLQAAQGKPVVVLPTTRLEKFRGRPESATDPSVREWVSDIRGQAKARNLSAADFANLIISHLAGEARKEIAGRDDQVRADPEEIIKALLKVFGGDDELPVLQQRFYAYEQGHDELLTCSLNLVDLYDRIVEKDESFRACREPSLKGRFAEAVNDEALKRELRRLNEELPNLKFFELRDRAIRWMGAPKQKRVSGFETQSQIDPVAEALEKQSQRMDKQQRQIDELLELMKQKSSSYTVSRTKARYSGRDQRCWCCGSADHMRRDCPKWDGQDQRRDQLN